MVLHAKEKLRPNSVIGLTEVQEDKNCSVLRLLVEFFYNFLYEPCDVVFTDSVFP